MAEEQPSITVTQSKVAFLLSIITLMSIVYVGSEKMIRTEFEIKELKSSYTSLTVGQAALRSDVKTLSRTIDGEVGNISKSLAGLTKLITEMAEEK